MIDQVNTPNQTPIQTDNQEGEKMQEVEKAAEKISEELHVELPAKGLLFPIRIIALFALLGGLGIIGSGFADILDATKNNVWIYIFRTLVGLLALAAAYGIIEHQRWALWLFGLIVFMGLVINPIITLFPLAALVYLFTKRGLFEPSRFDRLLDLVWQAIREKVQKQKPTDNLS